MASSYLGDPSLGNERSGSSRKGKKSNSDKPKQPQRGLGVAQLEQIRLSNEMGSCYMPSLHNPSYTSLNQDATAQMRVGDMELTDSGYGEPESSGTTRIGWNYNQNILQPQQEAQSSITRQLLTLPVENSSHKNRMNIQYELMGSGNQNSNSSDDQELDLDLKL
eukprot:TRINITY_DN6155_c0_g1_i2.p1 TRINITY_DN6155_c0_g1~~TRINITY_DN6155_c0_g1_i2.p1  ORF type:complete len:164 (+),score=38.42 TRINITY_DN6155_c0_g1_i2:436-927(+)